MRRVMLVPALLLTALQALGQEARLAPHARLETAAKARLTALAFPAGGSTLLAGDEEGNVTCLDLERKAQLGSWRLEEAPLFLAGASDGRGCLAVGESGTVTIVDLLKEAAAPSFRTRGKPLRAALDAGGRYLAVATEDETVELFDVKAMLPAGVINARDKLDGALFLGFDRLGQQLVAVRKAGEVTSWNPATLKPLRELSLAGGELHGSATVIRAASTNRAASIFAVGLEELAPGLASVRRSQELLRSYMVAAYDWGTGVELKRVKTRWPVEQMAVGPGGDHLSVTNEDDNTIALIDLRKGEVGATVSMEDKPVVLAVSDNNRWLAAGTREGSVMIWRIETAGAPEAGPPAAVLPSLGSRIRTRGAGEPALTPGEKVKLAILGFEARGVAEEVADVCMTSLANGLANVGYVTLVERRQIEKIINEQKLQLSGLTEEEGVEVGKLSKADVVLLGSVGKLGTSLVLSARLISVTTGNVLKGREVVCEECRDQDIYDAVTLLLSTIAQ